MAEEVGRRHADAQAGLVERGLEARDDPVALGAPSPHGTRSSSCRLTPQAPSSASLRTESDGIERFAGRAAEGVAAGVADGPEPEREAVLGARRQGVMVRAHAAPRSGGVG